MSRVEIISRFRNRYGEKEIPQTQIYFWINEVKWGRTDLNTIASAERAQ
jgi:hypothetical protein